MQTNLGNPKLKAEAEAKNHQLFRSFFELDKLAHERKNYVSPVPYLYMFSQNYLTIDKFVTSLGKRVQLTGEEIETDFRLFDRSGSMGASQVHGPAMQRLSRKRTAAGHRDLA